MTMGHASIISIIAAIVLIALFAKTLLLKSIFRKRIPEGTAYRVEGMHCAHCKAAVENHVSQVPGATGAEVDLKKERVYVKGSADEALIKSAVEKAGFTFGGRLSDQGR